MRAIRAALTLFAFFVHVATGTDTKPKFYPGIIHIVFRYGTGDQQADSFLEHLGIEKPTVSYRSTPNSIQPWREPNVRVGSENAWIDFFSLCPEVASVNRITAEKVLAAGGGRTVPLQPLTDQPFFWLTLARQDIFKNLESCLQKLYGQKTSMIDTGENYAIYRLPKATQNIVKSKSLAEYAQIEIHILTCNPLSDRILLHVEVYGYTAPGRYYYSEDDPKEDDRSDLLTYYGGYLQDFTNDLSIKLAGYYRDAENGSSK